VPAPKGMDRIARRGAGAANNLAYYAEAFRGTEVLAPRGWYCIGSYGSRGSDLLVAPPPVGPMDFSQNSEITGPAIELDYISADNGSGRFDMAQILAHTFPAQKAFVQSVIDSAGLSASNIKFGPYPMDKLIVQTDKLVQFVTPAHSDGLGTMVSRLKASSDPIDGVVIWDGPRPNLLPDLLVLRVRLPRELRGLASIIIDQVEREHR
jgi:hypothetical protein